MPLLLHAVSFVFEFHLRKLNYDPLTSFEPICYLVRLPPVIAVNSDSPYRTLADLLNAARTKPGDVTLGGTGPATSFFIAIRNNKRGANVDLTFVPFPGSPPAINALLGQHVTAAITNYGDIVEQLKSGKVRVLATASTKRIGRCQTYRRSPRPASGTLTWTRGLASLRQLRRPRRSPLEWPMLVRRRAALTEIMPKLVANGIYPVTFCGNDYVAYIRQQYEELSRIIRRVETKTGVGLLGYSVGFAPRLAPVDSASALQDPGDINGSSGSSLGRREIDHKLKLGRQEHRQLRWLFTLLLDASVTMMDVPSPRRGRTRYDSVAAGQGPNRQTTQCDSREGRELVATACAGMNG